MIVLVAAIVSVLVTIVIYRALAAWPPLSDGTRRIVAICVVALGITGLVDSASRPTVRAMPTTLHFLMAPYEALVIAIFVGVIVIFLMRLWRKIDGAALRRRELRIGRKHHDGEKTIVVRREGRNDRRGTNPRRGE